MSDKYTEIAQNHPSFDIATAANNALGDARVPNPVPPNMWQRLGLSKYRKTVPILNTYDTDRGTAEITRMENEIRDPLTGAYNRRYMIDKLNELKKTDKFCIVMVDVDHFKKVNDMYGHQTGDEVLKHVFNLLNSNIRTNDMLARYGGEEFLILLKDYSQNENVAKRLENLSKEIESTPSRNKRKPEQVPVQVTASFGYIFSDNNTEPADLVDMADKALYQAKQTGRNRIVRA